MVDRAYSDGYDIGEKALGDFEMGYDEGFADGEGERRRNRRLVSQDLKSAIVLLEKHT